MTPLTIEAPAKLNLYLEVGRPRPDGYHDVRTVLVTLDLHDTVVVEQSDRLSVVCSPAVTAEPSDNLAWKAAEAFGRAVGREPAFAVTVEKRIPAAAGLGGGSADAAAVLAALAAAWSVPADDPRLSAVARELGADVPFLMAGGCALYEGRGDRIVRRLPLPHVAFALVNPGTPLSTAEAYAAFDRAARTPMPGPRHVTDAIRFGDAVALGASVSDNMTGSSSVLVPSIWQALASVRDAPGCLGAAMAGSGATVFGVFEHREGADAAAEAAARPGWWTASAEPRSDGTNSQTGVKP